MSASPLMKSALHSIRVVELTEALAGPYCAMLLGDLGADVIKVERRQTGDQSRGWGPPWCGSESAYFLAANRNKRSLTLDYDHPLGREILERLLATADVFLINQPSLASLQRRGIDPESLQTRFPQLICCSITGYGLSGPYSGQSGYDIIAQAEAGVMSFTGEPDDPPMRYPVALADLVCGIYASAGILAALYARVSSGRGQFLDMALFDSQLTLLANIGSNYLNAGVMPEKWGNAHPSIVPYQLFEARDRRHFVIGVASEALWWKFTALLGIAPTVGKNPRFQTNALRISNRGNLIPLLQELFLERDANDWVTALKAEQIPAALIADIDEALSNRQVIERGLIVELEHPLLGGMKSVANPIRMSGMPASYRLPPPILGEHTREVLAGMNFTEDEIAEASFSGAV